MSQQLFLPGLESNPAMDFLFFAFLLGAENAAQITRLRECLCHESGLKGSRIAAQRLHITIHGIGAYDGLPTAVVDRARQAGAAISAKAFDVVLDRAISFGRKRYGCPLVLRAGDESALVAFHRLLGGAMKNAGFRRVASQFSPHVTLLYGDRVMAARRVEAVRWTMRDFVLVQSLRGRGQGRYIHLARWALRG
jgi:2'-5' RNA ligase